MDVFITQGGSVINIKKDYSAKTVDIEGLFSSGANLSSKGRGCISGYIITGITYQDSDITIPVAAVDQSRVLYSAGPNFGHFSVEGTIFFDKEAGPLSDIYSAFNSSRVSNFPYPQTVTGIGAQNLKVFVNKIEVYGGDPQTQSVKFSVSCIAAPVTNKR